MLNEIDSTPTAQQYIDKLLINVGNQIKVINDYEIAYLYILNKIVYLVTNDNNKYTKDSTLDYFEKILNPSLFYRINRQFIVHLNAIKEMKTASKQRIKLRLEPPSTKETITSSERTPQFKKWLLGQNSLR
jgi:DNA-binding LytR/AlgR family response regulator